MHKDTNLIQNQADRIARFVKKLNHATNVYVSCYDSHGTKIVDFPCDVEEKEVLKQILPDSLIQDMLFRVIESRLEDQILEDTPNPSIQAAASAVKINGRCRLVWICVADLSDENNTLKRHTSLKCFVETLDILHDMAIDRLQTQLSLQQTEEENRRSQFSVNEMTVSLRRIETMTEILKYFDSDSSIEQIMCSFLQITANYLMTGMADIFKVSEDTPDCMDVAAWWCDKGVTPVFEKTLNQKRFSFLKGNKPIIVSADSPFLNGLREEKPDLEVKALAALPVIIGQHVSMYACFFELKKERTWKIEEMQFLSDAIRVLQNIIEKRIQKNSLASSYASLEEILENVGCAIVVLNNPDNTILFQNQIMKRTFPKEKINPELLEILYHASEEKTVMEFYDRTRNAWYEIHHNHIRWVDGRLAGLFAVYDVTDKKNYQRKIEQQAYTDFLTGLYNRLCCERDLAKIVDESKKYQEKGALLYLDLDDFKHINDGLGHQYGDVLLKSISSSLKRIEGIENTCYRMGGDEFVIVIPPQSYARFESIIEDIKAVFAKPWFLKDADYYCTMSMGIVSFPDEGESVEDLIKKADIAMYEAKKTGKNRVATYNSENLSVSNRRLDMEKNMRDATANGYREFEIYYQPIIDIQKPGTPCTGAEALIRWNSSELGFISPGDFIPLAEYLGLINPIGNYVLKEACIACHNWNENGHPEYKVNVNLSVIQLLQNDIVEIVENTLKETGLNPRNLTLEVTESLAINDMERMKEIMSLIRRLGVRIALDDFGTGYSSLNHIREIPLDVIKVDQSFVHDLVEDDYSKSFIKMVAELAGAIGVSICVEGIEHREQYKVLEGMKVRLVQGFYFDRPMPREDFEKKYLVGKKEKKSGTRCQEKGELK